MMYTGSEAYRLDASEGALNQRRARPSFEVVEGAGLDAQVRRGVSPSFLARVRVVAIVAVVLAVLGIARVGVFAATVSVLSDNTTMRSDLKEARSTEDELKIERSVLSSSSRIDRIATQNYGMVRADSSEKMSAGAAAAAASASSDQDGSSDASDNQGTSGDSASADAAASADSSAADASAADASAADSSASAGASDTTSDDAQPQTKGDTIDQGALTQGDGSTAGANAVDVDSLL